MHENQQLLTAVKQNGFVLYWCLGTAEIRSWTLLCWCYSVLSSFSTPHLSFSICYKHGYYQQAP